MATLIIHRSSDYINRIRSIRILVDGKEQGKVANGEELRVKVKPGPHTLQAKIDWAGSRKFRIEAKEGEEKHIHLSGFRYGRYFGYMLPAVVVLGLLPYRIVGFWVQMAIMVPVFLFLVYYLTIGRHDYLTLKEWEETRPAP